MVRHCVHVCEHEGVGVVAGVLVKVTVARAPLYVTLTSEENVTVRKRVEPVMAAGMADPDECSSTAAAVDERGKTGQCLLRETPLNSRARPHQVLPL